MGRGAATISNRIMSPQRKIEDCEFEVLCRVMNSTLLLRGRKCNPWNLI